MTPNGSIRCSVRLAQRHKTLPSLQNSSAGTRRLFATSRVLQRSEGRLIGQQRIDCDVFGQHTSPRSISTKGLALQREPAFRFFKHPSSLSRKAISTKPLPSQRGPVFRFFYRFFAYTGGFILVSGSLVLAFFAYDASTYRADLSFTDIPVSVSALNPRRGGPKNLPIAEVLVDDDDSEEMQRLKDKPKLVILGSGWGSVALLKMLNPEDYHITVVSPVNYFLFTPMLPSATVGTLELRSLVEPVRRIVQRVRGHFLKAEAENVEFSERLLEVSQVNAQGEKRHFYLPYDKLVIGVGILRGG